MDYVLDLFAKYKQRGVLIDTNLLLLIAVGNYDRNRIPSFKNTQKYTIDDYALMMRVLGYFDRRVTTPNILTEVDNLGRQLSEREHRAFAQVAARLIMHHLEVYYPSDSVIGQSLHWNVGLTDSVTFLVPDVLVVTDDFGLAGRLTSAGRDAVNINHIRLQGWVST